MSQLLQDWVTRQAELRPEARCIVFGQDSFTYGELEKMTNQLAHLLRDAGCRKGDRVAILMPKCPEAIVSMIGILKAGCMHVPIDSASPAARIGRIFESCENRWALAGGPVAPLLDELLSDGRFRDVISIGWLDKQPLAGQSFQPKWMRSDLESAPTSRIAQECTAEEPAHILFTSGSTGTPKGVVITHANVMAFVNWALQHFGIEHTDRFSGHTPFHFDLSTFDIFGSFAAGAQLHLIPPGVALLPPKLVEFIRRSELTQWFSVPSVLNYVAKFNALRQNDFPSLRRVLWCGEVLPTPALIYWMRHLAHVRFTNLYGPTEATIASSYYDVRAWPRNPKDPIPIGTACGGEELHILNDDLETVAPREIGNLYISGAGLSPGYWRDPDKTGNAFLVHARSQDPKRRLYRTGDLAWQDEAGLVYFVGRADTQIKSRGYRIELGEIETALNSFEALQECAVVAIQTESFGGWMICGAYVPCDGAQVAPPSIRKHLEKLIPSYMLPVRWMCVDVLPKNANGKIDRPRLRQLFLRAEPDPSKDGRDIDAPLPDQTSASSDRTTAGSFE
jgi:amino acid adenylation domain-containing protein